MLGSMTYMYGTQMILEDKKIVFQPPTSLFTAVPSKPNFSHGFLWDEGFHQHLISVWDLQITYDVVTSWFNTIDKDGWISRE